MNTESPVTLEIACGNWTSCLFAKENGANRIELFENLSEGGCTPSFGMIKKSLELELPIYVMIRPRGGNFLYSDDEFEIMKSDIEICKQLGVHGIVFGILDESKNVDIVRCKELLELWDGPATFHRAFDETPDPYKAVEEIINLGFERILTSGQKPSIDLGMNLVGELISKYGHQIHFLPGCGVNPSNGRTIIHTTGAKEIHATCKIDGKDGYGHSDPAQIKELRNTV